MALIIIVVLLVTIFLLSYSNFKKETYKTKEEKVKSMQVFALTWALVVMTAVATYFIVCYFAGWDPFSFM